MVDKSTLSKLITKKHKILIIDDDPIMQFIAHKLFKLYSNFEVDSAYNGIEGSNMANSFLSDLVLLDVHMPGLRGFDTYKIIKHEHPQLPVIFIASTYSDVDLNEIINLKGQGYITKPLISEHVNNINSLLTKNNVEAIFDEFELGLTYKDNKIQVVELYKNGQFKYADDQDRYYNILQSIISLETAENIKEFEELINYPKVSENDLQNFFIRYPQFLLNNQYKTAHSKIILESDKASLIPDFILEPFKENALSDILDIKLPNSKIYTLKKNRIKYSAGVLESCAQLREYASFFDDPLNREKIFRATGLTIYKPQMIVIIGRTQNINPIQQRRIQLDLPGLQLKTYDDILAEVKRSIKPSQ